MKRLLGSIACAWLAAWLPDAALARQPGWFGPPGLARVRIAVRVDRVLVTTDLTLSGRPERARAFELHAAYGAPGTPLAADAELLATPPDQLAAPSGARGARLRSEPARAATEDSDLVLGRPRMAGRRIRASEAELASALTVSRGATLRLREVRALPGPASDRSRELLIRLGSLGGVPLPLGVIEITGERVGRREARFCSDGGSTALLATVPQSRSTPGVVSPALAKRGAGADLCVKLWVD